MATAVERRAFEEVSERLRNDTPFYAEEFLKILPKQRSRGLISLEPSPAQVALDAKLEAQREAGKPQFAIVCKSRQVGMSTWIQAKLVQRSTLTPHHHGIVVAHDVDSGGKLFAIGHRMYRNLPEGEELLLDGVTRPLRPEIRSYKRARFLAFGEPGHIGLVGDIWPDSTYWVDTANEFESGRGSTPHSLHLSEYAFWPQPEQKFIALMQAVPEDPDTLVAVESTPNGHNHFKDLWDDAYEGRSEFIAFFWPWWKQAEYTRPFANNREREEFRIGDTEQSPYAEEEADLRDPGPIDTETGEHVALTLEQLNWRRWAIANRCGGKIEKFHQEFATTPEQGFLATGRKVFEPMLVAKARAQAEKTDPRVGEGGPVIGAVVAGERKMQAGRHGKVEVPKSPIFKPARLLPMGEDPNWRFWLDYEDGKLVIPEDGRYVVGVDVSEGLPESDDETGDPAFQAIQVIDHRTKEQVAEYRSRVDMDLLAEHAVLTAILFNDAWLAIEKTGPGVAVVTKVWHDFHYTYTYWQKKHGQRAESDTDRLGWNTDRSSKHLLISGGQELLREETHGIKSRRLVSELQTYIKTSTAKMVPEHGKFADLLMAWLLAQQVAIEKPIRKQKSEKRQAPSVARRYSAYQ